MALLIWMFTDTWLTRYMQWKFWESCERRGRQIHVSSVWLHLFLLHGTHCVIVAVKSRPESFYVTVINYFYILTVTVVKQSNVEINRFWQVDNMVEAWMWDSSGSWMNFVSLHHWYCVSLLYNLAHLWHVSFISNFPGRPFDCSTAVIANTQAHTHCD